MLIEANTPFECHIDPETLREVPHRPTELAAMVDAPPAAAEATTIGVAARMLGRFETAERHLASAAQRSGTVAARVRLAHVWQCQGRFDEALAAFDRCRQEAVGDREAGFVAQHTGKCHYDRGEWGAAAEYFASAMHLRTGELFRSSRLAFDSAQACVATRAIADELDRLVPAVHRNAASLGGRGPRERHGAPPAAGMLIELRSLLRAGPVPMPVVAGIYRYVDGVGAALEELRDAGWLRLDGAVQVTPLASPFLDDVLATVDRAARELWAPASADLVTAVTATARAAVGTSEGPVFDAWMATSRTGADAEAELFEAINALRYHRADAHAAAWAAERLDAAGVRVLADTDPVRRRIEASTDRVAARPYRRLPESARETLLTGLAALPV